MVIPEENMSVLPCPSKQIILLSIIRLLYSCRATIISVIDKAKEPCLVLLPVSADNIQGGKVKFSGSKTC